MLARSAQDLDRRLGEAVRLRRKELGLTQADLADACGITFQQVQKYENGGNRISFSRLVRIARCLGSNVSTFCAVVDVAEGTSAYARPEYECLAELPDARPLLESYAKLKPAARATLLRFLDELTPSPGPAAQDCAEHELPGRLGEAGR